MSYRRTILVTGGAGNVGGALADAFVGDDENYVVVVDDLSTGSVSKLPAPRSNFRFVKADANDYDDLAAVMLACRFDYVFHYAAVVGVRRTLDHPIDVLADIHGIENILRLSKNTGVRRVFYSSSSEVYGEPVELPQHEHTTPLNSRLPYAVVKNVGESFLRSYTREFGLEHTVFRFFNTYGPRQSEDFVVPRFLSAALEGSDIVIYGDGSQTRTFCYIDDNVAVARGCMYGDLAINDIVNVGSDVEVSILDLARTILDLTGSSSKIVHVPPLEEGDMTRRRPDIAKMRAILGRDLTPLDRGLRTLLEHVRANAGQ
jgi:UDP-glucose 4-epimerase